MLLSYAIVQFIYSMMGQVKCHCWILFILWWGSWCANIYESFWQEVNVESLILRWPLKHLGLLFFMCCFVSLHFFLQFEIQLVIAAPIHPLPLWICFHQCIFMGLLCYLYLHLFRINIWLMIDIPPGLNNFCEVIRWL